MTTTITKIDMKTSSNSRPYYNEFTYDNLVAFLEELLEDYNKKPRKFILYQGTSTKKDYIPCNFTE